MLRARGLVYATGFVLICGWLALRAHRLDSRLGGPPLEPPRAVGIALAPLGARVAAALMSIHAMKGVEIGHGFQNARKRGTEIHDEFEISDGRISRPTNNAGGLEGGITTGGPLVARVAMKPISTTLTPLNSVDLVTGKTTKTEYERSDFCSVPRAAVVGEAMLCFVLAEALLEKLGGDSVREMRRRFEELPDGQLDDLEIASDPRSYWE